MLILPEMFTCRHNQLHDRGRNHSKIHTKHICIYVTHVFRAFSSRLVHRRRQLFTTRSQFQFNPLFISTPTLLCWRVYELGHRLNPDVTDPDFLRPAEHVLPAQLLTRYGLLAADVRLLHTDNCSFLSRPQRSTTVLLCFCETAALLRLSPFQGESDTLGPPSVISTLVHIYRDRLPSKGLFFCDGPTRRVWNSRKRRQVAQTALFFIG